MHVSKFKIGDIVFCPHRLKTGTPAFGKVTKVTRVGNSFGDAIYSNDWVDTYKDAENLSEKDTIKSTWICEGDLTHASNSLVKLRMSLMTQEKLVVDLQQALKEAEEKLDKLKQLEQNLDLLNEIFN